MPPTFLIWLWLFLGLPSLIAGSVLTFAIIRGRQWWRKRNTPAPSSHSFLSPEAEAWRARVRTSPEFKRWFDFGDDISRLGSEIAARLPGRLDNRQLTVGLLFVHAHEAFEGAIVSAERGLISEARAQVRMVVESAIALGAITTDEGFIDRLIEDDQAHRYKTANAVLDDPDLRAAFPPDQVAKLRELVSRIKASGSLPKRINWEQLAKDRFKDLYNLVYRYLSGDGVHVNVNVLNRHARVDANQQVTGIKRGPTDADLLDTLDAACLSLLWAALPTATFFGMTEFNDAIGKRIREYDAALRAREQ